MTPLAIVRRMLALSQRSNSSNKSWKIDNSQNANGSKLLSSSSILLATSTSLFTFQTTMIAAGMTTW
jgi:hypothetical protein